MTEHNPGQTIVLERAGNDAAAVDELCQRYSPLIYRDLGVYGFIGTICENL